jgi:hypothetical protein
MHQLMVGVSAYPSADPDLLRNAGIGWVREGFRLPFADRVGGEPTEQYVRAKEMAQTRAEQGLKVMGVSPLPGIATKERQPDGTLRPTWRTFIPEWAGELGSEQCLRSYEDACAWLAEDLQGLVQAWQIANELDIPEFAGPLNPRQGCDLVLAGARGLKAADPSLFVGHNPAGAPPAYFFFGRLFGRDDGLIDYCGVDGYYGTWAHGGPRNWSARVSELHELTGAPVLVNEWGFSSAGEVMTPAEDRSGAPTCQLKKWRHTWGKGHTPDGQADFVAAAFEEFRSVRDALAGVFFYRWEDQESCWQCGAPDCPAETAWGLVDLEGRPKPAYGAFRDGARMLLGG